MATFNVFVEGAVDTSPAGATRLAEAMAQRYGLAAADLVARFQRGRFRVKSNVDAATAATYRRDLEQLGARVLVEDSALAPTATPPVGVPATAAPGATVMGAGLARKTPASGAPATRTPTPPAGATVMGPGLARKTPATGAPATTPPATVASPAATVMGAGVTFRSPGDSSRPAAPTPVANSGSGAGLPRASTPAPVAGSSSSAGLPRASTPPPARPSASSLPPATGPSTNAAQPYASGLAAAYSQEIPVASDLGALDAGALSLASLDGEDSGPPPGAFDLPPTAAPAAPPMPASFGPPAPRLETPKPAPSASSAPVDLFAPPEAAEAAALSFELSTDEVEARAKRRASAPPEEASATPVRPSSPALAQTRRTPVSMAVVEPAAVGPHALPRTHVIAGVVLAVLVAFIPVHFVAATRERSAYAKIDREVLATQAEATTPDAYLALDGYRAEQREAKESARTTIALTSVLMWAVLAAGLAYVYFRRVPWDRVLKRPA